MIHTSVTVWSFPDLDLSLFFDPIDNGPKTGSLPHMMKQILPFSYRNERLFVKLKGKVTQPKFH